MFLFFLVFLKICEDLRQYVFRFTVYLFEILNNLDHELKAINVHKIRFIVFFSVFHKFSIYMKIQDMKLHFLAFISFIK